MNYLSKFLLGNTTVKLRTNDRIDNKQLIQSKLEELNLNLNHNIEDSFAYKFNNEGIGKEISLPQFFIDFVITNINLSKGYDYLFSPFLPLELNETVENYLTVTDKTIYKKKDVVLDTSFLRRPFLIDTFNQYLNNELKLENYLIEIDNYFVANGNKEWVIAHESIPGTYGIKDECLLVEEYEIEIKSQSDIESKSIILSSDTACVNKIEYSILPDLYTMKEFELYSESNNLKFIILDKNKSFYQFG